MSATAAEPRSGSDRSWTSRLAEPGFIRPVVLGVLALIVLSSGRFFSSGLPSWTAAEAILTQSLFVAVIAFGQGLVMLIGGLDLSIPGVIALSATILALSTSVYDRSIVTGVVLAIGASAMVGLVDGYLISRFQIPAFIVTLAMGGVLTGTTIGMTFGRKAPAAPEIVVDLFSGSGKLIGIALPVFVFVLVGVVGWFIQSKSRFGRTAYLLGSSRPSARLSGVPVQRAEVLVYVVAATAFGVAGIMLLGFSGNAQLSLGDEWLMPAIAAVLVGGTMIGSGYGFWLATFAASVLLTTITVVIQATGFSQGWKSVLYGSVVLLALLLMRTGSRSPWTRFSRRPQGR